MIELNPIQHLPNSMASEHKFYVHLLYVVTPYSFYFVSYNIFVRVEQFSICSHMSLIPHDNLLHCPYVYEIVHEKHLSFVWWLLEPKNFEGTLLFTSYMRNNLKCFFLLTIIFSWLLEAKFVFIVTMLSPCLGLSINIENINILTWNHLRHKKYHNESFTPFIFILLASTFFDKF